MLLFIYYQCMLLLFCVCVCVFIYFCNFFSSTDFSTPFVIIYIKTTAGTVYVQEPLLKILLDITVMLRVQRHVVRSLRPFVARRPCVRNFSGQGDEVEEEKEGPYNAETYRKRMNEVGT